MPLLPFPDTPSPAADAPPMSGLLSALSLVPRRQLSLDSAAAQIGQRWPSEAMGILPMTPEQQQALLARFAPQLLPPQMQMPAQGAQGLSGLLLRALSPQGLSLP